MMGQSLTDQPPGEGHPKDTVISDREGGVSLMCVTRGHAEIISTRFTFWAIGMIFIVDSCAVRNLSRCVWHVGASRAHGRRHWLCVGVREKQALRGSRGSWELSSKGFSLAVGAAGPTTAACSRWGGWAAGAGGFLGRRWCARTVPPSVSAWASRWVILSPAQHHDHTQA